MVAEQRGEAQCRLLQMSSAWLRPEKSPVETGQGRQVARVCTVRRPREGFFQVKKTSSKAGMWVCKDHSGFSVRID